MVRTTHQLHYLMWPQAKIQEGSHQQTHVQVLMPIVSADHTHFYAVFTAHHTVAESRVQAGTYLTP